MANIFVSGGSGYIASFTIAGLLKESHIVKTSVRSLKRADEIKANMATLGAPIDNLSFAEADLNADAGWDEAVAGAEYVLHMASPFPLSLPKHPDDLIVPAREGTLRVLRAAAKAGVKRTLVTSSIAAIVYGHTNYDKVFDESDWSDVNGPHIGAYAQSKTLAEKAAWDFIEGDGKKSKMELTTVNPAAVLGPVLGKDYSSSIAIVEKMLDGSYPALPNVGFAVVDVRDLAQLHLLALFSKKAAGQRYIGGIDFFWMGQLAKDLKEDLGSRGKKIPTGSLPDWVVKLIGKFDKVAGSIVGELSRRRTVTYGKAKGELGWQPRPVRQTVLDTANSLFDNQIIKG